MLACWIVPTFSQRLFSQHAEKGLPHNAKCIYMLLSQYAICFYVFSGGGCHIMDASQAEKLHERTVSSGFPDKMRVCKEENNTSFPVGNAQLSPIDDRSSF